MGLVLDFCLFVCFVCLICDDKFMNRKPQNMIMGFISSHANVCMVHYKCTHLNLNCAIFQMLMCLSVHTLQCIWDLRSYEQDFLHNVLSFILMKKSVKVFIHPTFCKSHLLQLKWIPPLPALSKPLPARLKEQQTVPTYILRSTLSRYNQHTPLLYLSYFTAAPNQWKHAWG